MDFSKKVQKIITFSVFVLAIFLILFHFTDTPRVWVDEGLFTEVAKNIALHGVIGVQTSPGEFFSMKGFLLSVNYPVVFPVALSLKLFGLGIWQSRLVMVLYMILFSGVFYLYVKKLYENKYGFWVPIISLLSLLSFAPFYGNGRPVQGEVPGLFFLVLGSLFLFYLERNNFNSKKYAILSGVALGLSASIKPIFLLGISVCLLVASLIYFKKIINKKVLWFLILGYSFPVGVWLLINYPSLEAIKSIIPSYIYFTGNHGSSLTTVETVALNFKRFFTESTPILFSFIGLAILASLFLKFKKERKLPVIFSELFLVCFICLNWLGYLKGTGWYRYFFPAHALLYLFFTASIFYIVNNFSKTWLKKSFLLIPILLLCFQFYYLVFLSDTSFTVSRTRNHDLQNVLSTISSDQKVLFYNSVEAGIFLNSSNYSQYLAMEEFLVAGSKDSLAKPKEDFILIDSSSINPDFSLICYDKKMVSKYVLMIRKKACK